MWQYRLLLHVVPVREISVSDYKDATLSVLAKMYVCDADIVRGKTHEMIIGNDTIQLARLELLDVVSEIATRDPAAVRENKIWKQIYPRLDPIFDNAYLRTLKHDDFKKYTNDIAKTLDARDGLPEVTFDTYAKKFDALGLSGFWIPASAHRPPDVVLNVAALGLENR